MHLLRNRSFLVFYVANAISSIGDELYYIALPWLILQTTDSSMVLGTITMVGAIPQPALVLIGGAVSDRLSARKVLLIAALGRAALVAALGLLTGAHWLAIWHFYFLVLAFGIVDAFTAPSAYAYLPTLVQTEQLATANSALQSTAEVISFVAPSPAGLFIKWFGTAWALFVDAFSFLFIVAALFVLPESPARAAHSGYNRNIIGSIWDGIRYVKQDIALTALLLLASTINFAGTGPMTIGLATIAKHRFGAASAYGLMVAARAAGSLLGVLLAGFIKIGNRRPVFVLIGTAIGLCIIAVGAIDQIALLALVLLIGSTATAFVDVQLLAWIQQRVDPAMMGRVMSVLIFAATALVPFSLLITGVAISWSTPWTFYIAGSMVLCIVAFSARQSVLN